MWNSAVLLGVLAFASITSTKTDALVAVPTSGSDWTLQYLHPLVVVLEQVLGEIINPYDPVTDMKFFLYTKGNTSPGEIVKLNDKVSLSQSRFNASWPTIFITHGWIFDINLFAIQLLKDEYLKKGNYNIFGVDWSKGGKLQTYVVPRYRTDKTGKVVAEFINFLERDGGARKQDISLNGFSLGAHVMGSAGKYLDGVLPVIVGLDPAAPLYVPGSPDTLNVKSALYVQVIHTNSELKSLYVNIGHTDFYVNGGLRQPECGDSISNACSHDRAPYVFIESINSAIGFTGRGCTSLLSVNANGCAFNGATTKMGGEPLTKTPGIFYVKTNNQSPYAQG